MASELAMASWLNSTVCFCTRLNLYSREEESQNRPVRGGEEEQRPVRGEAEQKGECNVLPLGQLKKAILQWLNLESLHL
jgi:hypothetical protein